MCSYGKGPFWMQIAIHAIARYCNTESALNQLIMFGEGRRFGTSARAYQQELEKCRMNLEWMDRSALVVEQWFIDNVDSS